MNKLLGLAVPLVLSTWLAVAGPASAVVVIAHHGQTGDWGYSPADDASSPAAKCGYSSRLADSYAHLRWVKVRGPLIAARDTTASRDHQTVSWQVKAQRQVNGGAWKTVASSAVHSGTAYDNTPASFSPIKLSVSGTATNQLWRALIVLKWYRNGGVEGWTKAGIEYYGVKWTVGTPDYVFTDACTGVSD